MSFFAPKFDPKSLKSNLKLCISRLELLGKKKTEQGMKSRREIADYILKDKIIQSRIMCEQIVRQDYLVEVLEALKTYCEVLLMHFQLLESRSEVDPSLEKAIATLIWSSRLGAEFPELQKITELFQRKYTKPFVQSCLENRLKTVDERIMKKISNQEVPSMLVELYLIAISKSYGVAYEPDIDLLNKGEKDIIENDTLISLDVVTPDTPVPLPDGHNMIPPLWDHGETSGGLPYPTTSPFPSSDPPPPVPPQPPVVTNNPEIPAGTDHAPPSYEESSAHEKDEDQALFNLPSVPVNSSVGQSSSISMDPASIPDDDFDDLSKRFNQLLNRDGKGNIPRGH